MLRKKKTLQSQIVTVWDPPDLPWDVEDPYRRGTKAARRCADEIDAVLATIIPTLTRVGPV